ncbi:lysosome-associated membrane glycoprotein 1 [Nephila pilipes]|uniref:Lysosome-associated membrane glycoprotein 5 n=1 Tax=Nephila pilipes TaxID=299642 RepID=A0A8X6TAQ4_NEPPI|nr:lysosome-associated membrane glycoprotein 1 [Nephila pilipes]
MNFISKTVFHLVIVLAIGCVTSDKTTTDLSTTTLSTNPETVTTTEIPTTTEVPTTTEIPTTIPTLPPTTTAPTTTTTVAPKPHPEEGSWNVTDGNVTCIRAKMQIGFMVNLGSVIQTLALSPNATTDGSNCNVSNNTQALVLSHKNYALTFIFEKDSGSAFVRNVTFAYALPEGQEIFYNDTKLFEVKSGHSYLCRSTDAVVMGNVTMEIYNIQIQAFGTVNENGFNTAQECEADDAVSDIIPIVVACTLAALIILVLIAYLVGRRRSRQKGYTSV